MSSTPGAEQVTYEVVVDPAQLQLRVTMRLSGDIARGAIRLEIPTWVPGDYTFMQLARDVFDIVATDTNSGCALSVTRDGWQAFHIANGNGDVTVQYRVGGYEIDFAEPCGIVDSDYAILMGGRYLHSPAYLGPITVAYQMPDAWRSTLHHASGAEPLGNDTWRYPSFEILLDSPVVMGTVDYLRRDVAGTAFIFAFVDRGVGYAERVHEFVDDVAAVAAGYRTMFGSFPFDDYTFVLTLNPAAEWGLEHLSSSLCGLGPDVFTDADQYATGIRVCSHELFHAWNVRRLRPAPLGELASQLSSGSFTEGLWMAEGFTRYYEFLSCARTGIYTADQFFSAVVGYWEHLAVLPAYPRVSAIDSSLSTYLTHSPSYPGRANNCIDYYDKGMLIAFCVDALLRLESDDDSLDRAFAAFYEAFVGFGAGHAGYTTEDAVAFFEQRQPGLGPWLQRATTEPGALDVIALLERVGFSIQRDHTHRLGIMFTDGGQPTIYNVLDDHPAGKSGLAPGDEITTINGFAYTQAALFWAARQAAPVTVGVRRGHRQLVFELTPQAATPIRHLTWQGNPAQAKRLHRWLREFPLVVGQVFSVDFYENFHGIETTI